MQNPFLAFYQRWPWFAHQTPLCNLWTFHQRHSRRFIVFVFGWKSVGDIETFSSFVFLHFFNHRKGIQTLDKFCGACPKCRLGCVLISSPNLTWCSPQVLHLRRSDTAHTFKSLVWQGNGILIANSWWAVLGALDTYLHYTTPQ